MLSDAHKRSMIALVLRRKNPRNIHAHTSAYFGRVDVHSALACVLSSIVRLKGGAL